MPARHPGLDGACWPTPLEASVLRAATLEPDAGARAWREHRDLIDIPALTNPELYRLLPAVYANLRASGTDDPDLPLMKGLYRRAFYSNRVLLHHTLPGIDALRSEGIDSFVLKGLAVALLHCGDPAVRPMGDIDVVVGSADAEAAIASLGRHGWHQDADPVARGALVRWRPAINMTTPEGGRLDLHWRLRRSAPPPDEPEPDDFGSAEVVDLPVPDGPVLHALASADLLLYAMEHGVRAGSDAHVRWAFDAGTIIRSAGDALDWARLVRLAQARSSTLQVRNALAYLEEVLEIGVPSETLRALASAHVGRREQRVFAVVSGARPAVSPWRLWSATSADWPRARAALAFPGFLRDSWGLRSVVQVPIVAVARAVRSRGRRGPGSRPGPVPRPEDRPVVAKPGA